MSEWEPEFKKSMLLDFETVWPALPMIRSPAQPTIRVLDIGSGMGTIDILLNRIYREMGVTPSFYLVDGLIDEPEIVQSYMTHSNSQVALDYLRRNGVHDVDYLSPDCLGVITGTFDLVISLGSWCFHYEPKTYLEEVLDQATLDTHIVVDIRVDERTREPRWGHQMVGVEQVCVLYDWPKAQRVWLRKK